MARRHQLPVEPLANIRGQAPKIRPTVRRLAAFANIHGCPTAAVAFAAGVDTTRAMAGTRVEMPFGQSPFAIGRGMAFESILRRHGHAELRTALTDGLGVDFSRAPIDNLREGYQPNRQGMILRASVTKNRMKEIAAGTPDVTVLDGAVLKTEIGGETAFFEADEMAIGIEGRIMVGENKSWPVVDGKPTDDQALGSALDQAATYALLGRRTLDEAGMDPDLVAGDAVLITPRNTGLRPVLHKQNVETRIRRIEKLLSAVPDAADIVAAVPSSLTFEKVADQNLSEDERLEAFNDIVDELGNAYEPATCLSSCGFAWACRECAFGASDPSIVGGSVARVIPGVISLDRVAELGHGAPASKAEAAAAVSIARAGRLYDEIAAASNGRRRR